MPTLKFRDPADGLWKPVDGFVQPHPQAMITGNAAQSLTSGSVTTVALNTVVYDTGGMTDGLWSQSSMRLIAPIPGYYRWYAHGSFASGTTGYRALIVRKNGTLGNTGGDLVGHMYGAPSSGQITGFTFGSEPQWMNAGDYLTMNAIQTQGAALDLQYGNQRYPSLALEYAGLVGPNGVSGATVTTLAATTDITLAGTSLKPTTWTALPFSGGWAEYTTSSYQGAQYRKVGDVVECRGMIKHATTTTTGTFATLPAGFAPPATLQFQATGSGGGNVDVRVMGATGVMMISGYGTGATGASIALNNVRFSTI